MITAVYLFVQPLPNYLILREQGAKETDALMFQTGSWSPQANIAFVCGGAAVFQPDSHG